MAELEITSNAQQLAQAIAAKAQLIEDYLTPALQQSAQIIAREAKRTAARNGSMAFSTLVNSINSRIEDGGLTAVVFAGTDYARFVEEGTKGGGYPPQQTLLDWLKVKRITPRDPDMTDKELAYLIARKIALNGTPARPFMEPAFETHKAATLDRINAAVDAALRAN